MMRDAGYIFLCITVHLSLCYNDCILSLKEIPRTTARHDE